MGAWTTTTPLGNRIAGGTQLRKDLTRIVVAHGVPYVAQASPHRWQDVVNKVKRALEVDGPSFLNILSPCPLGWRFEASDSIRIAELAVECCFWPLFEVREGKWKLSYRPREKRPVAEWLRAQGRFDPLFRPGNEGVLQEIQDHVDQEWERLLRDCGVSPRREEVVTP
jgi:pyruvate ferredoxin oxidoreductase beta subunit